METNKAMEVIEDNLLKTLKNNASHLNTWLEETGAKSPEKALPIYIKLLEMNLKLDELKNNGVNGEITIEMLVFEDSKTDISEFIKA